MRDLEVVLRESALLHGVLPLTSVCNVSCMFCSNLQNPPGVEQYRIPHRPLKEVFQHIPLLRAHEKVVIGESATRIIEGEPYTYGQVDEVLLEIRRRLPGAAISVTTNGILLQPGNVSALSETGAQVTLSLNALSTRARLDLMGDRSPSRVVTVTEALARTGIELYGSMVAVPAVAGWDDFRDSVRFLADHGAKAVRVFIPGFTQVAQGALISRGDETRLFEEAEALAGLTGVPVLVEPVELGLDIGLVEGIIPRSPADAVGLRRGDRVMAIDGEPAASSTDAHDTLTRAASPVVTVSRGGQATDLALQKRAGEQPGVVMRHDIGRKRLGDVLRRIQGRTGHSAIITSRLAARFWRGVARRESLGTCEVFVAENGFYGGNIACAGLLTVQDFSEIMRSRRFREWAPELVLLPQEPFDPEGRDLVGVHWRDACADDTTIELA